MVPASDDEGLMLRTVASIALIFLSVSTACAQGGTLGPSALFQGIVLDAHRKIVGRLVPTNLGNSEYFVVRQISPSSASPGTSADGGRFATSATSSTSAVWVALPLADLVTGFTPQALPLIYYYQSTDCTGQAYLLADQTSGSDILALGIIATVPPATQPSIYYAGLPWSMMTFQSALIAPGSCNAGGGAFSAYAGLPQSVPVSSLGLTLPFSVE
jgi:hypothetical protein